MYIIDFFKNLFKKNNIGTIIWMVLNTALICFFMVLFSGAQDASGIIKAIVVGLVLYLVSVLIALSPLGEWFFRMQNGCKKIKDNAILDRMMPLFNEVYENASAKNPEMPKNIKLYMSNDEDPNAFAMGRHTVCFTKGLLAMSDDDILGILGHEFGHLAHKDTDILLVMTVGNMIVSGIFVIWRVVITIFSFVLNIGISLASDDFGTLIANFLTKLLIDVLLVLVMKLWTKLGVLICMASSRSNEFLADKYSAEIGYGSELAHALTALDGTSSEKDGIWAVLNSSHPKTVDRVRRLNELA